MKICQKLAGRILGVAIIVMLAGGSWALAQQPQMPIRPDRTKVPAVTRASYEAPDQAPEPPSASDATNARRRATRRALANRTAGNHDNPAGHRAAPIQPAAYEMLEPVADPRMSGAPMSPGSDTWEEPVIGPPPGEGYSMGPQDGAPCDDTCCAPCGPDPCCTVWENFSLLGGVQAFKSPVDQGVNGNFGFHEGVNWGFPLFEYGGMGAQLGVEAVQSDLSGGTTFNDHRSQFFLTAGLFHRAACNHGWQGGVVFDWLHDDYFVNMNVSQIRGEIGWICHGDHEWGFWTAQGTTADTAFSNVNQRDVTWKPLDMYALFYRKYFCNGAIGRFSAGFTGEGDGLIGADVLAPLTCNCALVSAFNYRIPDHQPEPEALREGWGLTVSLVWFPGYKSPCSRMNPYRPVFGVADNTTLFLNQTRVHTQQ